MDLKNSLHFRPRTKRKKGDTSQLAAQLAPLEEMEKRHAHQQAAAPAIVAAQFDPHYGSIIVDNDALHVPKEVMEGGDEKTYLGMEPVVIVILVVMLLFIAFVAWQITLMPPE